MEHTSPRPTVLPAPSVARRSALAVIAALALAVPLLSAGPAQAAPIGTAAVQTQRMSDATLNSTQVGWYAKGSKLTLQCFKRGQSVKGFFSPWIPGGWDNLWYKVSDGYFVADVDIDTGSNNPVTGECGAAAPAPAPAPIPVRTYTGSVGINVTLNPNDSIVSPNGKYRFIQQSDGNLVLYGASALWANRIMLPGAVTVMQGDGNLVTYQGGKARWASNTNGKGGARLSVQDDGNVVIYTAAGKPVWATNTAQAVVVPGGVKADRAVAWANSMVGSTAYPNLCERFVENAYGTSGKFGSAIAAYNALRSAGAVNTSKTNIPKGALVFSSYYAYDKGSGHVQISRGDGTFVSGGALPTATNKANVQIYKALPAGYLGWAMPPASWPGR